MTEAQDPKTKPESEVRDSIIKANLAPHWVGEEYSLTML
jgi:hypothetical protein